MVLCDVGANPAPKPHHLHQYALMCSIYAKSLFELPRRPRVALLNIGEEGEKGNEQVRLARHNFEKSQLNFVGNIEGRDIFSGKVDIVVCDGFVGNVALKLSEGISESSSRVLKQEFKKSLLGRIALMIGCRSLKKFENKINYEEYGGAPLLGINGVGVVCHGQSSARAIKNAIKQTAHYVKDQVLEKMVLQLSAHM